MGLFEILGESNYKWMWFIATFVGSILPIILRFFLWCAYDVELLDVKDLLFAGLALNLANLTLVGHQSLTEKALIASFSGIFIVIFAFILGCVTRSEVYRINDNNTAFEIVSIIVVILSAYLNFETNNYVYQTVSQS
jgi:hypothetical protein